MGFFLYYVINVMIAMIRTTLRIIIKTCFSEMLGENYHVGPYVVNGIWIRVAFDMGIL